VNSGTWVVKYLIQFSIWNSGAKNLNSIYDSLVKYGIKIKKIFMKMVLVGKKFSFFNEKLGKKLFLKKFIIKWEIRT